MPKSEQLPEVFELVAAAERLLMAKTTLRRRAIAGIYPHHRVPVQGHPNGKIVFTEDDLREILRMLSVPKKSVNRRRA